MDNAQKCENLALSATPVFASVVKIIESHSKAATVTGVQKKKKLEGSDLILCCIYAPVG